jgi:hypothetical protein
MASYSKFNFFRRPVVSAVLHAISEQVVELVLFCSRLAHALASSFNFQGRVKKTFFVLTDDKVGSGPRLRPQSLLKETDKNPSTDKGPEPSQPMETDSEPTSDARPAQGPPKVLSLSAKLAAKRKATDSADSADSVSKSRR